jgi:hypothetical protein
MPDRKKGKLLLPAYRFWLTIQPVMPIGKVYYIIILCNAEAKANRVEMAFAPDSLAYRNRRHPVTQSHGY